MNILNEIKRNLELILDSVNEGRLPTAREHLIKVLNAIDGLF